MEIFKKKILVLEEMLTKRVREIEKRVDEELQKEEYIYPIFGGVISLGELRLYEDLLSPVFPQELKGFSHNLLEMKGGKEEIIGRGYLESDVEEESFANREFLGEILWEENRCPIKLKLRKSRIYSELPKNLYSIFMKNMVRWRTLNFPQLDSIYELVITNYGEEIKKLGGIEEITYDLEEFQGKFNLDKIVVWNIKKSSVQCEVFPRPIEEKIVYEHRFEMGKEGAYLCDSAQGKSISTYRDGLGGTRVISEERCENIELYMFSNISKKISEELNLSTNLMAWSVPKIIGGRIKKKEEFSEAVLHFFSMRKRGYRFTSLGCEELAIKEVNEFIDEEFQLKNLKKPIFLEFTREEVERYSKGELNFLFSELSRYLSEYKIGGVISEK